MQRPGADHQVKRDQEIRGTATCRDRQAKRQREDRQQWECPRLFVNQHGERKYHDHSQHNRDGGLRRMVSQMRQLRGVPDIGQQQRRGEHEHGQHRKRPPAFRYPWRAREHDHRDEQRAGDHAKLFDPVNGRRCERNSFEAACGSRIAGRRGLWAYAQGSRRLQFEGGVDTVRSTQFHAIVTRRRQASALRRPPTGHSNTVRAVCTFHRQVAHDRGHVVVRGIDDLDRHLIGLRGLEREVLDPNACVNHRGSTLPRQAAAGTRVGVKPLSILNSCTGVGVCLSRCVNTNATKHATTNTANTTRASF